MKDKIYKEPKTQQEKQRDSYGTMLSIAGAIIFFRMIANPEIRWFFWVIIVWGIFVLLYALKFFILKDKVLGKKTEGEEEIMENENKSK